MANQAIGAPEQEKPKRYYVYTLAYPDGKVFYVGKGQKDRLHQHEIEAAHPDRVVYRNRRKLRTIQEIWASGEQVQKSIVFETNVEEEAYMYEWALINMTCMGEHLTNIKSYGGSKSLEPKPPQPKPPSNLLTKTAPKVLLTKTAPKVERTPLVTARVERRPGIGQYPLEINGETYHTAASAARYLDVSQDAFYRNVKDKLQVYRHGALRREYFRQSDLDRYKGIYPAEKA